MIELFDFIIVVVVSLLASFKIYLFHDRSIARNELKRSKECEKRLQQRWEESRIQTKRYATACDLANKMYDKLLCEHAELQRTFDVSLDSFIIHKRSIQRIKSICDKLWEVADPKPETETEATNDPDLHPDC